jgi:hypothetical protein
LPRSFGFCCNGGFCRACAVPHTAGTRSAVIGRGSAYFRGHSMKFNRRTHGPQQHEQKKLLKYRFVSVCDVRS